MLCVERRFFAGVARRHQHRHARIAALNLGNVVIPLHELALQRDSLLFDVEHDPIDKRRHFAAIGQQSRLRIARLALAGVRFSTEVRISRQHVTAIGYGFGQHEGPGAHRPCIERQIALCHAGLAVKTVGFPGNWRDKRHGKPVVELRVQTLDADAQRAFIKRLHARKPEVTQIEPWQIPRTWREILA